MHAHALRTAGRGSPTTYGSKNSTFTLYAWQLTVGPFHFVRSDPRTIHVCIHVRTIPLHYTNQYMCILDVDAQI